MTSEQKKQQPRIVCLVLEPSIGRMAFEVLLIEGYPVDIAHTASDAFALLKRHSGNSLVIMDNLHNFAEGQRFLAEVIWETELWARTTVLSLAVGPVCTRLQKKYGRIIDAHLAMPFTADQLLRVVEVLGTETEVGPQASASPSQPKAIILAHELSVTHMNKAILELEGHDVCVVRTAAEVVANLASSTDRCIIVMDYPHNNPEALALVSHLRNYPVTRARARLVGASAVSGEQRATISRDYDLDEHLAMPYLSEEFISAVARVWSGLDPNVQVRL